MSKNIFSNFVKYVSFNVMGMLGLSFYVLGDTFFVAQALGATGLAALNFSISIYSLVHASGLMIGIGGAAKYSMLKSRSMDYEADKMFTSSVKLALAVSFVYIIIGIFGAERLALLLGADSDTLGMTRTYLTVTLCFAPFYLMNNTLLAFVRNDNNPNLAMIAMITGSVLNVILDYIFMFPLGMGMFGAAFATGLAPIISMGVLSIHFIKKKNSFRLIKCKVKLRVLADIIKLGMSAFVTEISSAIALITFNLIILQINGNLGVASYGIVANMALIGVAVFTGVAQGIQPLVSRSHGKRNIRDLRKIKKYSIITALILSVLIYAGMFFKSDTIISIFNSENSREIADLTKTGIEIYFLGFLFAGFNIVISMYLSATERARDAFIISISRGCLIIVPLVILMSRVWDMSGVWLAFVITEFIVAIFSTYLLLKERKARRIQKTS